MKKIVFVVLFTLSLFIQTGYAQVVTPSLDSAKPTEMAAANAWRFGSTVATDAYFDYVEADETNDAEIETEKYSALFAYQPGNFVSELYYSPYIRASEYDPSTDSYVDREGSEYALRLAIRGNRQVSVGLGYYGGEVEYSDGKNKTSFYEGSFSMRLFDGLLYAAAGMQRVTLLTASGTELKYNSTLGGAAMQIGDPAGTMFRLEGAVSFSPETRSEEGDTEVAVYKTSETSLAAELLTERFLISYRYRQNKQENYSTYEADFLTTENHYGVGFRFGSLRLSFYRQAFVYELDELRDENDLYRVTLGFNFI